MTANDCALPVPNPFISFDYNSAVQALESPKALSISNCEFRNSFGFYSNIAEVPSQGAQINVTDSSFHHISSCSAVVGNVDDEMFQFTPTTPYL